MRRLGLFMVLVTSMWALSIPATACSVPVFQWALDNWEPDAHELVVFHSGTLNAATQKLVDLYSGQKSNLHVRTADVSKPIEGGLQALWDVQKAAQLPWAVLQPVRGTFSGDDRPEASVWAGPFTEASVAALVDSPVRRQIADGILEGTAGVWLFLDSGQAGKDDAAFERLQSQLEKMPAHLSAIALELNPQLEEHPGEYAFSLIRLSRNDTAESALVQLLLHTEPDLPTLDEPMAFPVYGRGRVLYALVGEGIAEATIREACEFLVAGCSCLIKDDNPGTDLLMAVDWNARLAEQPVKATAPPPVPSREVVAAAEAQQAAVKDVPRSAFGKSIFIGLAIALAIVAAVTFAVIRKNRTDLA